MVHPRLMFHSPLGGAFLGRRILRSHPPVHARRVSIKRKSPASTLGPSGKGVKDAGIVLAQREGFERGFICATAWWASRSVVRSLRQGWQLSPLCRSP